MTGEKLYAAYCAALWVDWPRRPAGGYDRIFGPQHPAAPVAWPFLHEAEQAGWNNLAMVLSEGGES